MRRPGPGLVPAVGLTLQRAHFIVETNFALVLKPTQCYCSYCRLVANCVVGVLSYYAVMRRWIRCVLFHYTVDCCNIRKEQGRQRHT